MIDKEGNKMFRSGDRISYFLSIQKDEKGKLTELLKVLGFKHKSMFYTRMNSDSWTLDEILRLCNWWGISINEFIGNENHNVVQKKYLEDRVETLEKRIEAILNTTIAK